MPVPSYRVPVRVARGTKAALDAGLADLQEGELCYATDENALYVIEGGILTPASADPTNIEIVNDTTPQLGGNLDTNTFQIISTAAGNIQIAPDTTGVFEVMGNTGNDAVIKLNCETNAHGIKLKSPPHSAAADYTLVFPNDTGSNGQALTTDGAGVMSWTTPSAVGSINDLTDVDTTTTAPTNGQALVWDNANTEWVPGSVAADLGATSIDALQDVDTTTAAPTTNQVLAWDGTNWVPADQSGGGGGATSLGDLTDVSLPASTWLGSWTVSTLLGSQIMTADGNMGPGSGNTTNLYLRDNSGVDRTAQLSALNSQTLYWRKNGGEWQSETMTGFSIFSVNTLIPEAVGLSDALYNSQIGDTYELSDGASVGDGEVLTWVSASSLWEPAKLPDATATRALLGIGEYVDDAAAGTGGVASGAMYYNTISSDYRLKS